MAFLRVFKVSRAHGAATKYSAPAPWWLGVVFALASGSTIRALHAQTATSPAVATAASEPVADASKTEAYERFQHGLALARRQSWDAALAEFMASRALYPTRSATRNAAIALQKLARYAEACDMYEELLARFGASMPASQVSQTRDELAALVTQTGEIAVTDAPAGVVVLVDGQERGTTPLSVVLRVNPGAHTVHLARLGFEARDVRVTVAAAQRREIAGTLTPLTGVGILDVRESSDSHLKVLVDAVVVGSTPWQGSLAPGVHTVRLQGTDERGSPPQAVVVQLGGTTRVKLRAIELDAALRVAPLPPNATVFIDGVNVGSGAWDGRLVSGPHRVDVTAPGRLPFQAEVWLPRRGQRVVVARLEPGLSEGRKSPRSLYGELTLGLPLASSFRGGADSSCGCSELDHPLGFMAAARLGYGIFEHTSLEVSAGYLTLSESMTRSLRARGEQGPAQWLSTSNRDSTRLSGPLFSVGLAARVLSRTPLTGRIAAGLAAMSSETSNGGAFVGDVSAGAQRQRLERDVSIEEASQTLLAPFVSTELRFGYSFSRRWSADLGASLTAFMPSRSLRSGLRGFKSSAGARTTELADESGDIARPGVITLPSELVAAAFLVLSPSIAVRAAF